MKGNRKELYDLLMRTPAVFFPLPMEKRHLAILGEIEWPEPMVEARRKAYAWIGDDRGNVRTISHRLFVAFLNKRFARWFVLDLRKTVLQKKSELLFSVPKVSMEKGNISVSRVSLFPKQWAMTARDAKGRVNIAGIEVAFYERPVNLYEPLERNAIEDRAEWYIFDKSHVVLA